MGVTLIYVAEQTQDSFETKVALAEAGFPTVHVTSVKDAEDICIRRGVLPILFESEFFDEMKPLKERFVTIERLKGADWDELIASLRKLV